MLVERIEVGPLGVNCWLVSDGCGGPVIVIDPGDDADDILRALGPREVSTVVLTHGHFDHLGAAGRVVEAKRAPLAAHEDEAPYLSDAVGTGGAMFGFDSHFAPPADLLLRDGDAIDAGSITASVIHTPGHTFGGICLFVEDPAGGVPHLFAGDTLFAGSVGRTDLPRGDARDIARSIASKLSGLPPETVVHPGHGPDTTIGREARLNPFWPRA